VALVGLVNLAEHLLNQTTAQGQDAQTASQPVQATANTSALAATEDRFTPSAHNAPAQATAQAAGLFTVSQFTLFTAAADFLLAHNATPQANRANRPAPAANVVPSAVPQKAVAASAPAPAAQTTLAANSAGVVPTGAAAIQDQLQALNNALAALGLDHADILVIDRVASRLQDFNPTAFTSLVYQLEALARNAAQQAQAPQRAARPNPPAGGTQAPAQARAATA
jgi:hypothetical protein